MYQINEITRIIYILLNRLLKYKKDEKKVKQLQEQIGYWTDEKDRLREQYLRPSTQEEIY